MGDLAFNIEKFVDLNKVVTLDIDKTVDVNVNNPDQLATAEADAEAFGSNALAETDAYTYVNEGDDDRFFSEGFIDAIGNSTELLQEGEVTGESGNIFPQIITQFFTPQTDNLPDIDSINAPGEENHLRHFDNALMDQANNPLPVLNFEDTNFSFDPQNDKVWEFVQDLTVEGGIPTAEYRLLNNWTVVLESPTPLDMDGDGIAGNGPVTMVIPQDTLYLVEFPLAGGKEIEFEQFVDDPEKLAGGNGYFLFDDTLDECHNDVFPFLSYVQSAETLEQGISDWAFQASYESDCPGGDRNGEAFAYAQSTAALDLG